MLSFGWTLLVPRHGIARGSWWMNDFNSQNFGLFDMLRDGGLLRGQLGATNTVLWSLRWEVVFSLLLPLVVIVGRVGSRFWLIKLATLFGMSAWGAHSSRNAMLYLPMFFAGSVLAFERNRIARVTTSNSYRAHSRAIRRVTTLFTVLLLSSYWPVFASHRWALWSGYLAAVARGLEVCGACLLICIALQAQSRKRVLESRPAQWLGSRSFSLYLVHEPIMASITLLLGGRPRLWLLLPCVLLASLLAAECFYRAIERPSLRFAAAVGRRGVERVRVHMEPVQRCA